MTTLAVALCCGLQEVHYQHRQLVATGENENRTASPSTGSCETITYVTVLQRFAVAVPLWHAPRAGSSGILRLVRAA